MIANCEVAGTTEHHFQIRLDTAWCLVCRHINKYNHKAYTFIFYYIIDKGTCYGPFSLILAIITQSIFGINIAFGHNGSNN